MSLLKNSKAISSIWMEGSSPSHLVPDQWGKHMDSIAGEIKETYFAKIDTVFKNWVSTFGNIVGKGLSGIFGKFLSKFGLDKIGINVEAIKGYIDSGKQIFNAAMSGFEIYQEFKNGNYEAALGALAGAFGPNVTSLVNFGIDSYRTIKNTDWHSFEGILSGVSKLTGVDIGDVIGYWDIKAKAQSLIQLAQKYNIPEALKMIREKFGRNPDVMRTLGLGLRQNIILGQIDTIDEVLSVLDGRVAAILNPDAVANILANYRFPMNYDSNKHQEYIDQLISIFKRIDPMWDRDVINGETYFKFDPWVRVSQDARTLFQHHEDYGPCVVCGNNYRTLTLREGLNNTYQYLRL